MKRFFNQQGTGGLDVWHESILKVTGIKSKQLLFRKMAQCGASLRDGVIAFSPSAKQHGQKWKGLGIEFKSTVSASGSVKEIGQSLREALSKCLPVVVCNVAQPGVQADVR